MIPVNIIVMVIIVIVTVTAAAMMIGGDKIHGEHGVASRRRFAQHVVFHVTDAEFRVRRYGLVGDQAQYITSGARWDGARD